MGRSGDGGRDILWGSHKIFLNHINWELYLKHEIHITSVYSKIKESIAENIFKIGLKWYYDQKIISFFSSDFESVFA